MNSTMTMTSAATPAFLQTLTAPRDAARPVVRAVGTKRPPAIWPAKQEEPALWRISLEATRDSLAERILFGAVAVLSFGSITWLAMVTWQFLLAWQGMANGIRSMLM